MTGKRKYKSPAIEEYRLDKDICIMMVSSGPGNPPPLAPAAPASGSKGVLKSKSPFGGDTPDYK